MATERQLQFRVGALVIVAASVCVALVVRFGDTQNLWKHHYRLSIHLENSAGLYPSAPVTLSGLSIGSVKLVELNQTQGGVNVQIDVQQNIRLPVDSRAIVTRSLLGETAVEFVRGLDSDLLRPGDEVAGVAAADPLVMIQRLETRTVETLNAFADTTQEWQQVAKNINMLMDTKRGNLDQVVERAADSLFEFTNTMKSANQMIEAANEIVDNPETQKAMRESLVALPKLVTVTKGAVDEIRQTVISARQVLMGMNRNLENLAQVTDPIGKKGEQIVIKLDNSLANIDELVTELTHFARVINQKDGTLQQLVSNPSLYNNLDRSSLSMALMLKHLEPFMRDLREFGDKVARNPELLGIGGAVRPSKGVKDEELLKKELPNSSRQPAVRGKGPSK